MLAIEEEVPRNDAVSCHLTSVGRGAKCHATDSTLAVDLTIPVAWLVRIEGHTFHALFELGYSLDFAS